MLFGWARLVMRNEIGGFRWRWIDGVLIAWAASSTLFYTLQWQTGSALINRLGVSFDAIGGYFFLRCLVRSWADVTRLAMALAICGILVACLFAVEKLTGQNMFGRMGGVPEITRVRNGRLRCQGAFSHPILAGCFWAAAMPIVVSLWWGVKKWRALAVFGGVSSLLIVFFCSSSTPVMAVAAAALGGAMFVARNYMRFVQVGVICALFGLHLIMNKPVWHLIARIDIVGGSTGWHRYYLVDSAIRNFGDWAIAGVKTTAHWGSGLQDVTNQYVLEGVRGGVVTLVLFVTTIVLAFGCVGATLRRVEGDRARRALVWGIGVALFVHCMSFIAVSYFGQSTMLWYLTLALAASVADVARTEDALRRTSRSASVQSRRSLGSVRAGRQLQHP